MRTCNFGEHLMIDGYGGDPQKLGDEKIILTSLKELPKKLGMKPLAKPLVKNAPDNEIKDPGGWSGFVMISESHISIHTFPARKFVSIDIYTCKNGMDRQLVKDYFIKAYGLAEIEENFVKRGTQYPAYNIG